MSAMRCSDVTSIFSRQARAFSSSCAFSSAMAVMPMMPFIGVRISCDMRERNSLFRQAGAPRFLGSALGTVLLVRQQTRVALDQLIVDR